MNARELDRLLDGAGGYTMELSPGPALSAHDVKSIRINFTREHLLDRDAFFDLLEDSFYTTYSYFGLESPYKRPKLSRAEFSRMVRVMFGLAEKTEAETGRKLGECECCGDRATLWPPDDEWLQWHCHECRNARFDENGVEVAPEVRPLKVDPRRRVA